MNDLVYGMDINGIMYIFKAAKQFELVGKAELGEDAMATPAFVHERIYIRGLDNLYCIGN